MTIKILAKLSIQWRLQIKPGVTACLLSECLLSVLLKILLYNLFPTSHA